MIGNPLATDIEPPSKVVMNSEPICYRAHTAILLSLIMLKNVLVVMTFWACRKLYLRRTALHHASLRRLGKSSSSLDTVVLANVMLDTGNNEQLPASPRRSTDKVEPVLDGDVPSMDFLDLPDFPDDVDLETEQVDLEAEEHSEADMDSMLESYRASQDELLGRVPLPPPSTTAPCSS